MSEVITETLTTLRCAACTIPFAITDTLLSRRRTDHQIFYCPIGHENSFRITEAEKTNEQLRNTVTALQDELITLRNVRKDVAEMEPKDWRQRLGLKS